MEANDLSKEDLSDKFGKVRVCQGDEVAVLAKVVHHRQDDGLAADMGKHLDKVQGDVRPHTLQHQQWEQKPGWVKVLNLVLLAHPTCPHHVLHKALHVRKMEVTT